MAVSHKSILNSIVKIVKNTSWFLCFTWYIILYNCFFSAECNIPLSHCDMSAIPYFESQHRVQFRTAMPNRFVFLWILFRKITYLPFRSSYTIFSQNSPVCVFVNTGSPMRTGFNLLTYAIQYTQAFMHYKCFPSTFCAALIWGTVLLWFHKQHRIR